MSIAQPHLDLLHSTAKTLEAQGYFERARSGDQRAASLFARLTAFTANPSGSTSGFGWLRKTAGGTNVDGYAEDSVVFGNNPADLANVVDMVNGAGAPNASLPIRYDDGSVKERRTTDIWEKPVALSQADMNYITSAAPPIPGPTPPVECPLPPPRDEALDELKYLDYYYGAPEGLQRENGLSIGGKPDFEGIAAWYLDVYQRARMAGKSREEARAAYVHDIRHSAEWQAKHPGETP